MQSKLLWTILLNIIITLSQAVGGIVSGSMALLSDATHNFSDVITLVISYIANRLAYNKEQSIDKTFGYKRAEIVAAAINATILIVLAIFLLIEGIQRFSHPRKVDGTLIIWISVLSIVLNTISVLLVKKQAKNNLNLKSIYLNLFSDVFTSFGVLVGGLLIKFNGLYILDPIITLAIAIYLFYMSWGILFASVRIIMQFAPKDIDISAVEKAVTKLPSVKNIHHVHIWQLNDQDYHLEAHVEFYKNIKLSEFDEICERIEKILLEKFNIKHSFLQPEWNRDDPKEYIIKD